MSKIKTPYEQNTYMANSSTNKLIDDLFKLSPEEFSTWADSFRKEVVYAWDKLGTPIVGGRNEDEIVSQFRALTNYDVSDLLQFDELSNEENCLFSNSPIGSACNQFFPTMLKTRNINPNGLNPLSIYDHFADDTLKAKFEKAIVKMLDRDALNDFSKQLSVTEYSGDDWFAKVAAGQEKGFYFAATETEKPGFVYLTKEQLKALQRKVAFDESLIRGESEKYTVRVFSKNVRIMDIAKIFRICFSATAVTNFPPLIAKYLYLRFTEECKNQKPIVIYDPSSGWGGRILGAMACCHERDLHYVGTDPNTDHWMPELGMTKYAYLADYFNGNVRATHKNTYELFNVGSEVIHLEPEFQKYRGD